MFFHSYEAARRRHAEIRFEAYQAAREEAIADAACGTGLRLADIDSRALLAWRDTWTGAHPTGAGGWNWPGMVARVPRRAAVLPLAIWYDDDLCGLVLGHASRHRAGGARHTVTLTYIERRPGPPAVPLRGLVVPLAVAAARNYGLALRATRLCLRFPDRNLLWYYELLGFSVAWERGKPVYCEKRI